MGRLKKPITSTSAPAVRARGTVNEESRWALQFLYNPKTQPGLGELIRGVLEKL